MQPQQNLLLQLGLIWFWVYTTEEAMAAQHKLWLQRNKLWLHRGTLNTSLRTLALVEIFEYHLVEVTMHSWMWIGPDAMFGLVWFCWLGMVCRILDFMKRRVLSQPQLNSSLNRTFYFRWVWPDYWFSPQDKLWLPWNKLWLQRNKLWLHWGTLNASLRTHALVELF